MAGPAIAAPSAAPRREPIAFRTKEGQVAEFLRERIISGFFARGQKLKQAEIAQMLDLSITPVREALKLLEAQGYVVGSSHRGAVVAPFQVGEAAELYELRLDLESRLTRAAAAGIDDAGVRALEELNDAILVAARSGNHDAARSANFRFHFRLYEMAGQPQTLHFVRILWAKYPFDLLTVLPRRQFDVADEHRDILDALQARDVQAATRAMESHIESGWRAFVRHHPEAGADAARRT
ncbi:DNA-binding GntR family transcriptional regulator [Stella humosa]|uniref:DNA-binding GntR family transcriptional regulator n=2 Tax=Stella humosa TaxID=94 RepID=A0A3N1KT60_9PROT|nr:DNA-binding GntR family transcriptional regulator [Stella humosa]